MGATQLPIEIEQGADFDLLVAVVGGPDDLTGWTGRMQIRELKASADVLYETIAGVTINVGADTVAIHVPCTETVTFDWDRGVYDVLITSGDATSAHRIVEGKVTLDRAVTREDA
jgi:hypothetical protein